MIDLPLWAWIVGVWPLSLLILRIAFWLEGWTSQFIDENGGDELLSVFVVFAPLAVVVFMLRGVVAVVCRVAAMFRSPVRWLLVPNSQR